MRQPSRAQYGCDNIDASRRASVMRFSGSNYYVVRYRQKQPAGNALNRATAIACADSPLRTELKNGKWNLIYQDRYLNKRKYSVNLYNE